LTMARSVLMPRKEDSKKSWVLCVSRPSKVEEDLSLCGKRITSYDFVFFFLGLLALYSFFLLFFFVVQSFLSFNIKAKKNRGRGIPYCSFQKKIKSKFQKQWF
jgi:hypothetical protein